MVDEKEGYAVWGVVNHPPDISVWENVFQLYKRIWAYP
jgi:hypothetical protein